MATAYALAAPRSRVKIAIVGYVDHSNSTLLARLLHLPVVHQIEVVVSKIETFNFDTVSFGRSK
jgi:sulfate adenylyltransferase subunit 1 (EFTu-like GTPase family)